MPPLAASLEGLTVNRTRQTAAVVALTALAALAAAQSAASAEASVRTRYSKAALVAEHASLPAAGGTITIGLRLEPDRGWHAYWTNPGDAGLPATLRWTLPDGFAAGELRYPTPHVIPFGDLVTYGFDEPILLLVDIAVPAGLTASSIALAAKARWVVCDDELCVPEQASLALTLPVSDGGAHPDRTEAFAAARAKLPATVDWPARFEHDGEDVRVAVRTPATASGMRDAYLFVGRKHLVRYARQEASFAPRGVVFALRAGARLRGVDAFPAVLAFQDSAGAQQAVWLDVHAGEDLTGLVAGGGDSAAATTATGSVAAPAGMAFGLALLFAFLGGVILNLMPCVFPILSMKALSLVGTAGDEHRAAKESGLLYTAGILVAFATIGALLLILRARGAQVGWGFHLQSATVNLALALLMLAIALNLAGVFEFGARLTGVGTGLVAGGERRQAFFTGLLAVLVAAPCTAPFMATALGYAVTQPAAVAVTVFLALGLGLAFPYLLLSWVPALGRALPRPGPWMDTFRTVLAFPMFGAAVWLFWVIGNQLGADAMAVGLSAGLALAFALWAFGRVFGNARPWTWRTAAAVGFAATLALGWKMPDFESATGADHSGTLGQLELEPFTPERVTGYLAAGQPLFLYFTADWCVSCKVNERVALASDAVGEAFRARGVKVVEGDWTNEDAVITAWLHRYGRVGVPLYLYFPRGATLDTAAVLPQILVPDVVINAVDAADAGAGTAA